jgi:hypothetical protein
VLADQIATARRSVQLSAERHYQVYCRSCGLLDDSFLHRHLGMMVFLAGASNAHFVMLQVVSAASAMAYLQGLWHQMSVLLATCG